MPTVYQSGYWTGGKRGRTLERHRNRGLELVLVLNGSVTWDYEGRRIHVPAGHLSFTWPWQWHSAYNNVVPSAELCWVIVPFRRRVTRPTTRLTLDPSLGLTRRENRHLIERLAAIDPPVLKASRLLGQLMPIVVRRLMADGGHLTFATRAQLLVVLASLVRGMEAAPGPVAPDARARVESFLPQLRGQCGDHWSLEQMARASGMGRTHFTRILKELTGDTPVQYLNRMRIQQAELMLAESRRTVLEVALACGFQSSQYFATVFRTFTGRAPRRKG